MAITARTATKGTAASGAGFTVTFATGSAAGDVVVLFVANAGTAGPAAPNGWTRYRNADSAGTGQSITTLTAPWSAGLTGSFTNAASAAAWTCNSYSGGNETVMTDGVGAASSSTGNNASIPVGNPTTGSVAGDYEVLGYAWTSGATITAATGSTIDTTQANGTAISCALGHNNTTSLNASFTPALGNGTLSASNTRKTGVGVFIQAANDKTVSPSGGSVSITGSAPTVATPVAVSPSAPTVTITGSAPAVVATQNVTVSPVAGSVTVTGATPTVTAPAQVSPSGGSVAITGSAPTVTAPAVAQPSGGTVTVTGATPSVLTPVAVAPDASTIVITGSTPAVATPVAVAPDAQTITVTGSTPTVLTPILVEPDGETVTITGETPDIATPVLVEPDDGTIAITGSAPNVAAGNTVDTLIEPDAGSLTVTGATPYVGTPVLVLPIAGAVSVSGAVPTVVAEASWVIVPLGRTITISGGRPKVRVLSKTAVAGAWELTDQRLPHPQQVAPRSGHVGIAGGIPDVHIIDDGDIAALLAGLT